LGALNGDGFDAAEFRIDDSFITGSDEEAALVKALESVFPRSRHVFTHLHVVFSGQRTHCNCVCGWRVHSATASLSVFICPVCPVMF